MIEEFYPICLEFKESKLKLKWQEKESLTQYLMQTLVKDNENAMNKSLSSVVLYDAETDGMTANTWHEKCDHNANTFTLVETEYDHIFGCFASVPFDEKIRKRQNDFQSFLCLKILNVHYYVHMFQRRKVRQKYMVIMVLYSASGFVPNWGHSFNVGTFCRMNHQIMLKIVNGQIIQIQLEIYYVVGINWIKEMI